MQIGRTHQSPLVGRDAELSVLRQLLLIPEEELVHSKTNIYAVGATLSRSTLPYPFLIRSSWASCRESNAGILKYHENWRNCRKGYGRG